MSESALGKASSGITCTDKGFACPTCSRVFDTEYGVKQHHAKTHNESLSKVIVECDYCGSEIERQDHHTQEYNYCDVQCKNAHHGERFSGKNHPCWSQVECECHICGRTVYRKPSQLEGQDNVYCSYDCHLEYQSKNQIGENHHNYNPNSSDEYGPNWHRQRRKALERDNHKCQDCGVRSEEFRQELSVHHIIPRSEFMRRGELDYQSANDLNNLVSLCEDCHKKWEGLYLRPDTRD